MESPEECFEVLAYHGRTFALAARLLPRSRRNDAAVLYAFCRYVDDVADETPNREDAKDELCQVRLELAGQGNPRPIVALFLEVAERRNIDVQAADYLIQAVLSDLGAVRFKTDEQLLRYCYGVAGTVGLMMCGVLGVRSEEALHFAIDLGVGMQLTNICRDIREDARRNRCYVPKTRLARHGLRQEDVITRSCDPAKLALVTDELLSMAERYYQSADNGMQAIPMPGRAAIVVAARVYRAIGFRLRRVHQSNSLHGRTVVPIPMRLLWAARALMELGHPQFWLWAIGSHDRVLHRPLRGLPGASVHV